MKKLIFILLFLLICSTVNAYTFMENWSKEDTAYQLVFLAVSFIDYKQTVYITKHQDNYYEVNPLLGNYPSRSDVDKYFITASIVHTLISFTLPDKIKIFNKEIDIRHSWQMISIGFESGIVSMNYDVGVKVEF